MTTTTAAVAPYRDEDTTVAEYVTSEGLAGGAVWDWARHDPWFGPDIAFLCGLDVKVTAGGDDYDDLEGLLFDLVTNAAELGHRLATIGTGMYQSRATTADAARVLAAIMHRPTVEAGQPWPDVKALNAAAEARAAAERAA